MGAEEGEGWGEWRGLSITCATQPRPCRGSLASSVSPIWVLCLPGPCGVWPCHLRFLSPSPLRPASLSAGQTPLESPSTSLSASLSHLSRCPGHLLPWVLSLHTCLPPFPGLSPMPSLVPHLSTDNWSVSHVLRPQVPCSEPRQWVQVASEWEGGASWAGVAVGEGAKLQAAWPEARWWAVVRKQNRQPVAPLSGEDFIFPDTPLLKASGTCNATCMHTHTGRDTAQ